VVAHAGGRSGGPWRRAGSLVRHAAGISRFTHASHGVLQELAVFVDANDPVKFSLLTLTKPDHPAPATERVSPTTIWRLGLAPAAGNSCT